MNSNLEKEIVKHIYNNFGIDSDVKSIINNNFLLKQFQLYEDSNYQNKIWGINLNILNQSFNINLIDISEFAEEKSYLLFINVENLTTYALYYNKYYDEYNIFVKSPTWTDCSTYLQSTFLSGMEQIREIGFYPNKIELSQLVLEDTKIILNKIK